MHYGQDSSIDRLRAPLFHGWNPAEIWTPESLSSRGSEGVSLDILNWASGTPAESIAPREQVSVQTEATDPSAKVFDQLVSLKVSTSSLAMHLDGAWRKGLFGQLDHLLDADDWDFSDTLPTVESFKTFLRLMISLGQVRRPSLGSTATGDIIAAWIIGKDRLTLECLPDDHVRWMVSTTLEGEPTSGAGRTKIHLLESLLSPYNPETWFGG
jgi:hypothetical protein